MNSLTLVGLLLASVLAVSARPQDASTMLRNTLNSANFTRLVEDLVKLNLVDSVSKAAPKTIFAPSNQAFRTLMMDNRPLANNSDTLSKLVRRSFVVSRRIMPADITNEMVVDTVSGEKLRFNIYNTTITVNGVVMNKEPIVMNNDVVVYRIDDVILSSFTSGQNIISVLETNKDRFSSLIGYIKTTGLTDTLAKEGPFTLFAPTNEAFRALPSEALARLVASPAEMKRVLLGHVVKGTFFLGAGLDSKNSSGTDSILPTLDGGSNKIMISGRNIRVDGIPVVTSIDNIMAENGVIHGMSHVLMPR